MANDGKIKFSTLEETLLKLNDALKSVKKLPMAVYDAPTIVKSMVLLENAREMLSDAEKKNAHPRTIN